MTPSLSTELDFIQLRLVIKQVARNLGQLSVRCRHNNSPGGAKGESHDRRSDLRPRMPATELQKTMRRLPLRRCNR